MLTSCEASILSNKNGNQEMARRKVQPARLVGSLSYAATIERYPAASVTKISHRTANFAP